MSDAVDVKTLPQLPPRGPDGHKGDYGRVLIVAGSRGMSGAAILAARAALRGGAGLVFVASPQTASTIVAASEPCCLTIPLSEDAAGRFDTAALPALVESAGKSDVVAIGPGLGQSPAVARVVMDLTEATRTPIVLDADGLNAFVGRVKHLESLGSDAIVTPHPGEFARLLGVKTAEVQQRRAELAIDFARRTGNITVLKGHETIVTDGTRVYTNATGNPGMGTGGSGDVLTGLLAALIAQELELFDATVLAVYLHGLAGDLAAQQVGEISLIASDLITYLPAAFAAASGSSAH